LCEVLSNAAESELGGLFHNGKEAVPKRITLEELGHPQPATPMVTDNSTDTGIANDSMKQKRSKAMDMRFYRIRDRVRQGQFLVYWKRGNTATRLTILQNIIRLNITSSNGPNICNALVPHRQPIIMRHSVLTHRHPPTNRPLTVRVC
jgi:hypothetical protein